MLFKFKLILIQIDKYDFLFQFIKQAVTNILFYSRPITEKLSTETRRQLRFYKNPQKSKSLLQQDNYISGNKLRQYCMDFGEFRKTALLCFNIELTITQTIPQTISQTITLICGPHRMSEGSVPTSEWPMWSRP